MANSEITTSTFQAHNLPKDERAERPNVLILMTDQQRHDTIHAAGFDYMITPNLDRLASEGCLYSHAFTPCPICLPARHNLITGLPPRYHGFPDNIFGAVTRLDLPKLPQILADAGYETRAIGKMHFVPPRRHNGFDKIEQMDEVPRFREEDEYAMYLKSVGLGSVQNIHGVRNLLYMLPQRSLIPEEHHGTTWIADRSVEFIRTNAGRHPFFLWSSWIAPHPPFNVVDSVADLYKDADLPEPYVSTTPLAPLTAENQMLGDLPTPEYVRRMRELYYAQVTHVDRNLGRILDALEEVGQLDNTLIIFTSDHAEMLGDHGMYQKWNPYDSCERIPFIMRYPGRVEAGSRCDEFIDLNDVLPTILDITGVEYPGTIPLVGESLVAEEKRKDREWQYTEYSMDTRRWISVRNKEYKYNYYYGGAIEQLFDLRNDPGETTNLLAEGTPAEWAGVRNEMRQKLIEYERTQGLEGYVGETDLKQGAPYTAFPQRNQALPKFPAKIMDETERAQVNDFVDEVIAAVEKEPIVKFRDLDIASWQKNCGFSDTDVQRLLETDERRK